MYIGVGLEMLGSGPTSTQVVQKSHDWFYSTITDIEFDESIALENDEFLGLALDYDNQDSLSEERINLWVNMIHSEFK